MLCQAVLWVQHGVRHHTLSATVCHARRLCCDLQTFSGLIKVYKWLRFDLAPACSRHSMSLTSSAPLLQASPSPPSGVWLAVEV